MEGSDVRSQGWRSRRDGLQCEGMSWVREARTVSRDVRAVATMGTVGGVVRRRCRVKAWPIPREDGVTRTHAMEGRWGWRWRWRAGKRNKMWWLVDG